MVGPFDNSSMYSLHISAMPVVLNTDGGWHMFMHLFYPLFISVNHKRDPIHTTILIECSNKKPRQLLPSAT